MSRRWRIRSMIRGMERSVVSLWTHEPTVISGKFSKSQDVTEVENTIEEQGYGKKCGIPMYP